MKKNEVNTNEISNFEKWKEVEEKRNEKQSKKIYIGYTTRLLTSIIIFSISLLAFVLLINKSFEYRDSKYLDYKENQSIDYRVYIKDNEFYEEEYLGKDMIYVASIIDKISVDFNYDFTIEEKTSVDFDYKIIAQLVFSNANSNTKYFEKEYTLLGSTHNTMTQDKKYSINENVEIDYNYYNELANKFKSSYGVNTNSYLRVYLQIDKKDNASNVNINDSSINSIMIPLSEKDVEITFDAEDTSSKKQLLIDSAIIIDREMVVIEAIVLIVTLIALYKIIRLLILLRKKKSIYDNFIDKTLRQYDRLIVKTPSVIELRDKKVIKIEEFEELLDVHDNLKQPIIYCNIIEHQKSYFYVKNGEDIYLMKVKAVDMEVIKDEDKKKS